MAGGITQAIHKALDASNRDSPAAELALLYARRIDECDHIRRELEQSLQKVRTICAMSVDAYAGLTALDKISAALSAVSVASDLGPKLMTALSELLLTPKARAGLKDQLPSAAKPGNPLDDLRTEEDELKARRDKRAGR